MFRTSVRLRRPSPSRAGGYWQSSAFGGLLPQVRGMHEEMKVDWCASVGPGPDLRGCRFPGRVLKGWMYVAGLVVCCRAGCMLQGLRRLPANCRGQLVAFRFGVHQAGMLTGAVG